METRETIAVLDAKLIVVGGDAKVAEVNLKLPSVIGRGASATLTLPHPLVSRRHCELFESDGQLMVRDLGSLNGTFIGSDLITEAVLPSGELLTVGTVTFRAVYGDDASDGIDISSEATKKTPTTETVQVSPSSEAVSPADELVEEVEEIFVEEVEEVKENADLGEDIEFVDLGDDLEFLDDAAPASADEEKGNDDITEFLNSIDKGDP